MGRTDPAPPLSNAIDPFTDPSHNPSSLSTTTPNLQVPSLAVEPPTPIAPSSSSTSDPANPFQSGNKTAGVRPFRDDPDEDEENLVGFGADGKGRGRGYDGDDSNEHHGGGEEDEGQLLSHQQVMMDGEFSTSKTSPLHHSPTVSRCSHDAPHSLLSLESS